MELGPLFAYASIQGHLCHYTDGTEKIIVFDKYQDVSAKDHERMLVMLSRLRAFHYQSSAQKGCNLKSKNNKWRLASVLGTFSLGENAMMETRDDGAFGHDEADITIIFLCP